MRLEYRVVPFTAIADGAEAAQINVAEFEVFSVFINTTAIAGAPTNVHYDLRVGHGVGAAFHSADNANDTMRTINQTTTGKRGVFRVRTTEMDFVWDGSWPRLQITPEFNGGAAPTVTGTITVIGRIR